MKRERASEKLKDVIFNHDSNRGDARVRGHRGECDLPVYHESRHRVRFSFINNTEISENIIHFLSVMTRHRQPERRKYVD